MLQFKNLIFVFSKIGAFGKKNITVMWMLVYRLIESCLLMDLDHATALYKKEYYTFQFVQLYNNT